MLPCPKCWVEMHWMADHDDGEETFTHMICNDCRVEVFAYWEKETEEAEEDAEKHD